MKIKNVETGEVLDAYSFGAESGGMYAVVFRDGAWQKTMVQAKLPGETRVYWVPAESGVDY